MGCTARVIMPLLSTLAALVILVHSAEEEMERHHLALRQADPGGPDYEFDQQWRAIQTEPMMQKSDEWTEQPQEEPPRRRRPGRKRKRRPLPDAMDASEPEERRRFHEDQTRREHDQPRELEPVPIDLDPQHERFERDHSPRDHDRERERDHPIRERDPEQKETMRKRRKRPEMRPWTGEETRPMRRRGQRRKRPKHNEFDVFQNYEVPIVTDTRYRPSNVRHLDDDNSERYHVDIADQTEQKAGDPTDLVEIGHVQLDNEHADIQSSPGNEAPSQVPVEETVGIPATRDEDDKTFTVSELEKAKSGPISPMALKELLKRSNGSSLSEILQQHNLSLADLLHGDKNALSALKSDDNTDTQDNYKRERPTVKNDQDDEVTTTEKSYPEEATTQPISVEITYIYNTSEPSTLNVTEATTEPVTEPIKEILDVKENAPKIAMKRPYAINGRRKMRLRRPGAPNTYVRFLSNSRRQPQNNATSSVQSDESADFNAATNKSKINDQSYLQENTKKVEKKSNQKHENQESTTVLEDFITTTTEEVTTIDTKFETTEVVNEIETTTKEIENLEPKTEEPVTTTTEKVTTAPTTRKPMNNIELRRQALTNRLKRKRLRQKLSTTESPEDNLTRDLFGMANLVSASEFIARAKSPSKTTKYNEVTETPLPDFFENEASNKVEKSSRPILSVASTTKAPVRQTTIEEAKVEIEEIFKDDETGERLSKILKERNMTLSELVEHRERGSSNVHLADIFHNTSREPNPAEPFLSKSLIEPISKETYPLRALLEANQHDPNVKTSPMEPNPSEASATSVPVVMNYGNNVNLNGENLGIMSLFNKITSQQDIEEQPVIKKDSKGSLYIASVTSENVTNHIENTRDGRQMERNDNGLNEIFSYMQRSFGDGKHEISESLTKQRTPETEPTTTEEEIKHSKDEDDVMVLEDLQHLKDFNNRIASAAAENIEMKVVENHQTTNEPPQGILDKIPNSTKSVTVATASILGLTTVVFLLTYVLFKWRQRCNVIRKKDSFCEEQIPTPVFENRKGNKNQSSTRSLSPMLSTSNIYTLNTLDSRNGDESPDYMWDSLRKPFQ
ncbi:uncharacterized protein LOC105380074 isoform X2 [Plutella xylostella]|uniref:uncharacterized protein LOC105380074 isoform X2 n=1 Tax=Plutella xylostella TaxID=51655 RepID=UPI0020324B6C|nr:uncharacterized protein LOC105380074 isoform X2 [Plutella xylostella]